MPKGEIVARPMVARACGCLQEFQEYAVDRYRDERLAKFRQTRCPACVAKLVAQQRGAAADAPGTSKREVLKRLPPGSRLSLALGPGGAWAGTLAADGTEVEAAGPPGAGVEAVAANLARRWFAARGGKAGGE